MQGRLKDSLSYKNLVRRPGRTWSLILLTALLSLSVFLGTTVTGALRDGLSSLKDRLGADIMVVPYEAATKSDLQNIVLQGNTGYFYMDESKLTQISEMDGISEISPQLFLASTSSGCCSVPVQIIGYDPDTDFTVTPWLKMSNQKPLGDMEVVVGNELNLFVGDTVMFYGSQVTVAGKLERTGTNLDTAVYSNEETIKRLIQSSLDMKLNTFKDIDPDNVVSCILINVQDGYAVEEVLNEINLRVKDIKAVQTRDMISGVADSLQGVSDMIGLLTGAIWIMALIITAIAFAVSLRERAREFAVLRAIGASRKKLAGTVMTEGLLTSLVGGLIGIIVGLLIVVPFNRLIESALGLPFLLPGPGKIAIIALMAVAVALISSIVISWILSKRISKVDTASILRDA